MSRARTAVPHDLRPSPQQLEAACHAYYLADQRALDLRQQAERAAAEAERLRVAALDLCDRERQASA